jgi:glucosamine 6-phosphate synthetase-like amidotransferase/phosphosugar isomerase protein
VTTVLPGLGRACHPEPTRDICFLDDGDMAVLTSDGVLLTDFEGRPIKRAVTRILWDPIMAEKGGYKHFMLKEIFEQPRAVRDTMWAMGRESDASSWARWACPSSAAQQMRIVAAERAGMPPWPASSWSRSWPGR